MISPKVIPFLFLLGFFCTPVKSQSRALGIGDSISISIQAKQRITKAGIKVSKGETYQIYAAGKWQDAGFEPTDAEGFPPKNGAMRFARFLQPMHQENYMKLVAKVSSKHWPVGTSAHICFSKGGQLILQPNDAMFFFGNNSGTLAVTIKRVK